MKSEESDNQKVKIPFNPFMNNSNQLPMINMRNKLKEIQLNERFKNNSKKKFLKKSNSFCGNCKPENVNDKESLYEKNIELKNELTQVRRELIKIKSENIKKEQEINKKEN